MPYPAPNYLRFKYRGRTYFFDATAGSDTNPGTYQSPLQTVTAANSLPLKPKDRVLFKCGETWTGIALAAAAHGRAGEPITYAAYGSGAAPIIDATGVTMAFIAQKNYITVDSLTLTKGSTHCVYLNGTGMSISNCTVSANTGGSGINLGSSQHAIVDNCIVHHSKTQGISIGTGCSDILVRGCTAYSNGSASTDHGIYAYESCNVALIGNVSYSNYNFGFKMRNMTGYHIMDRNTAYSNTAYGLEANDVPNLLLKNNLSYGNGGGIFLGVNTTGALIYHNTCVNQTAADYFYGIELGHATVLGNTLMNNLSVQDVAVVGTILKRHPIRCEAAGVVSGNTINNNLWYAPGATTMANLAGTAKTMAQWQALTGTPDLNGVSADPVFVTAYTDLHLQTTSPAKNAGATGLGVLADYDQVVRDATPDIGAYEFH
jgi:parallel beta-helix repeat protein